MAIHFMSGRPSGHDSLLESIDDFSKTALEQNLEILKRYPQVRVELLGFTDSSECVGNDCRALSERRVRRVLDWILSHAISSETVVKAEGRSAEMPVGDNGTEEGRSANRRVEFILTP